MGLDGMNLTHAHGLHVFLQWTVVGIAHSVYNNRVHRLLNQHIFIIPINEVMKAFKALLGKVAYLILVDAIAFHRLDENIVHGASCSCEGSDSFPFLMRL